jgi:hypothetical protein
MSAKSIHFFANRNQESNKAAVYLFFFALFQLLSVRFYFLSRVDRF